MQDAKALTAPLFNVVLVRPEIPQNTGSIARTTAATRTRLHLVGPLGFSIEDRYLKRAGLDYWPLVDLRTYPEWAAFDSVYRTADSNNFKYFSARAQKSYLEAAYRPGDFLVFGSETRGLGEEFLRSRRAQTYRIPIFESGVRSLNLANAVSIVMYEGLRQCGLLERA
jgi:tRNA (cytidine/uridine-2'-O-)-methyltransferase